MNALTTIDTQTFAISKKGAIGSFALAIAFADRNTRLEIGQTMYAAWIRSGNFQSIVNDTMNNGFFTKSQAIVMNAVVTSFKVQPGERLNATQFAQFCDIACATVGDKELKGKKAFIFGILSRVSRKSMTVDA